MNDKLLVEAAVLAGEIMLVSGAEIYRVEDTINHILQSANLQTSEAIVLSTGIFAMLNDSSMEAITVVRRVTARSTNLNKVYLVNQISRSLCCGRISVEEAFEQLKQVQTNQQYRPWMKNMGLLGASIFFTMLLGGVGIDYLAAALIGGLTAMVFHVSERIRLNDFCKNSFSAFTIAVFTLYMKQYLFLDIHRDILIISAIMPLLPGVIFTTAIRDTLNGDYAAGTARILEAIVIALAVAAGVGAGMAVFSLAAGGTMVW